MLNKLTGTLFFLQYLSIGNIEKGPTGNFRLYSSSGKVSNSFLCVVAMHCWGTGVMMYDYVLDIESRQCE